MKVGDIVRTCVKEETIRCLSDEDEIRVLKRFNHKVLTVSETGVSGDCCDDCFHCIETGNFDWYSDEVEVLPRVEPKPFLAAQEQEIKSLFG